jgi:hypothetical protein
MKKGNSSMKNFIAAASLALALGTCALAQSSQAPVPPSEQTIQLVPFGTWLMCEVNPSMAGSVFCQGAPTYIKGQEPDLLLVTAQRSDTAAFAYTIAGTDINGQTKTYTGIFLRNDALPNKIASYTVINAGVLHDVCITIQELSSTVVRQQTQS